MRLSRSETQSFEPFILCKTRGKMFNHSFSQSITSCGIFWHIVFEPSVSKTPAEILLNLEISRSVLIFAGWKTEPCKRKPEKQLFVQGASWKHLVMTIGKDFFSIKINHSFCVEDWLFIIIRFSYLMLIMKYSVLHPFHLRPMSRVIDTGEHSHTCKLHH